ncbi:MAG: fumarate reductase subunit C [candidate division NC10 bacterium]|nr:fumarate reductase subunit C [candidate division NC10 bacterium]MBI3002768.1 fumarate reductase subunit C [candidate division NC10 bacterium]MBI4391970.1 fumarate reductase subunit C [candidate division NC10 bacterium]
MSAPPAPRPGLYYPKMPATWWLRRPAYLRFMLREVSSVFIAIFLAVLMVQVYRAGQGPEAYAAFLERLASPGWIAFHAVALGFALYHSVTWLKLTAVVQVVRLGEHQVPPRLVAAGAFAFWGILSLAILFAVLLRS